MTGSRIFLSRLWALVRHRQMDHDIDDEIAGHLGEATDEYIQRGLSPEDARLAALRSFGGVPQTKEVYRQVGSFMWLDELARDLRFGARMLRKERWITLAAVVALAIGIAANNTVFTIVNAILLRDLPFDESDRIVAIGTRVGNVRTLNAGVSYADFHEWRAASQTLEGLGAMRETTMNVGDDRAAPERSIGSYTTGGWPHHCGNSPQSPLDVRPCGVSIGSDPDPAHGRRTDDAQYRRAIRDGPRRGNPRHYVGTPGSAGREISTGRRSGAVFDERLAGVPGLVAGIVSHPPFGGGVARNLWRDDEVVSREPRRPRVFVVTTGPRYFDTFRRRIVRGSELPLLEGEDGAAPVILNEWLATAVFPGEDPIGRRIRLTPLNGTSPEPEWFTIAGIAPDISQSSTEDSSGRDGVIYMSYGTNPMPRAGIVARSDSDPSVVATVLREQVRAADPDLPLFEVMTLDDWLAASDERVGLRVFGTMFVVFAFVAMLLATVGLYAVTAYAAAQRTREIGVRVALGAQAAQIWWLVTRRAAGQLGLGLAIGMVGAIGIGRLLAGVLVGTNAVDPVTLLAVAGLLATVGLSACLLPARRAMRLDPATVLRYE